MSISVIQNATAVSPGISTAFLGIGGTGPYTYTVLPGGAGGTIDSSGIYTAPSSLPQTPSTSIDTIRVVDSLGAVASGTILVGSALELLCDILQNQLGLAPGRVYLWDQKINMPTDNGLYIAVSVPMCKPFGNNISYLSSSGLNSNGVVNMMATVDIDIISRGPAARDEKEQVLIALMSVYSEQQQEANSFHIARLPVSGKFINLSQIDGAAIPYRYKISFNMTYGVTKLKPVPYFSDFRQPSVVTNP